MRSFKEYVDDLELFVAREVAQKITATKSLGTAAPAADERFVYVANSMAGAYQDDARIRCSTCDENALCSIFSEVHLNDIEHR